MLAEHPVAAALHFERILDIVFEEIIGWCKKKGLPYRSGGLFGIPKAWVRVIEEQARLTLHTLILIWLHGHGDIEGQLDSALKLDNQEFRDHALLANSEVNNFNKILFKLINFF